MRYRAVTEVLLGHGPPAQPGEIVPDTFIDSNGTSQPVDFERLSELGAVEKLSARAAREATP